MIRDAASNFIEKEVTEIKCAECASGLILMQDVEKREFALGCNCQMGQFRARSLKLKQWNGEDSLLSNGRSLHRK